MINTLTKAQVARMPEFVAKWLRIGLSTADSLDPIPDNLVADIYSAGGLAPPAINLQLNTSPLGGVIAYSILRSQVGSQVWSQVSSQVSSQVESQVSSQVRRQVESQVSSQVSSQVWSQIWSQVRSQVSSQVSSQVWSQVSSQVWSQVGSQVWSHLYGSYDAAWLSYYDYMSYLGIDCSQLQPLMQLANLAGWCLPYEKVFIATAKPSYLYIQGGKLHNERDMALQYPDGWGIYALHGVVMRAEHILMPASDMRVEDVLSEKSVDIRRELVRKIGLNRIVDKSRLVDAQGDYKLIDLASVIPSVPYAPYLVMRNPSVADTMHVEGVSEECKTVEQAINWRAGGIKWTPAQLS